MIFCEKEIAGQEFKVLSGERMGEDTCWLNKTVAEENSPKIKQEFKMTDETPSFVDMEKIEQEIENEKVALNAGYLTYDRFLEKKLGAAQGLIQFGDAFCRALGETLLIADRDNAIKILRYFHAECNQNKLLWEIYQAKYKANNS